jgi:hypothetical protein
MLLDIDGSKIGHSDARSEVGANPPTQGKTDKPILLRAEMQAKGRVSVDFDAESVGFRD